MTDLEDLKAKALAATPGPWYCDEPFVGSSHHSHNIVSGVGDNPISNGHFIAAANPGAVLELIERLESAESERDALRAELEAKTSTMMGVGDGAGKLFVYGDHDSIKAVQALILQGEQGESDRAELESVLQQWNEIVLASGSKTHGGAIGHVSAMRAEQDAARKQEPYCWVWSHANGSPGVGMFSSEQAAKDAWDIISPNGSAIPLYASPVPAQQPADVTPNTSKPTGEQN